MKKRHLLISLFLVALLSVLNNSIFGQTINNGKIRFSLPGEDQTSEIKTNCDKRDLSYKTTEANDYDSSSTIQSDIISIPLEEFGDFIAVGIVIDHAELNAPRIVQIRNSVDSVQWNDWEVLEQIDLIEKELKKFRSNLLFIDKSARYVQIKVTFKNENNSSFSTNDVTLFFTSPLDNAKKKTERYSFAYPDEQAYILKSYARPAYVNRKGWGCPQDENTNLRELTNVTHLIIHHSAGSTTSSNFPAVVLSYWDYHVNGNGWDDIGYNWLIDGNGVIYKGRAWYDNVQENVKGAHNSSKNNGTAGVCMIGNYTGGTLPTTKLWESTYEILAFLCDKYGLNPKGVAYHAAIDRDNDVIAGHRDSGGGTECPGDIANYYSAIRQEVADRLSGTIPSGPTDMDISIADCPSSDVTFSWLGAGTGWRINISTDSTFNTYYIKWVSGLSTYSGPEGFVLAPEENIPLEKFQEGTKYFWRILFDGDTSVTRSFTMHSCSSINYPKYEDKHEFSIYPNPSDGNFVVDIKNEGEQGFIIKIYNTIGIEMFKAISNSNTFRVSTLDLPSGTYLINMQGVNFNKSYTIAISE